MKRIKILLTTLAVIIVLLGIVPVSVSYAADQTACIVVEDNGDAIEQFQNYVDDVVRPSGKVDCVGVNDKICLEKYIAYELSERVKENTKRRASEEAQASIENIVVHSASE